MEMINPNNTHPAALGTPSEQGKIRPQFSGDITHYTGFPS